MFSKLSAAKDIVNDIDDGSYDVATGRAIMEFTPIGTVIDAGTALYNTDHMQELAMSDHKKELAGYKKKYYKEYKKDELDRDYGAIDRYKEKITYNEKEIAKIKKKLGIIEKERAPINPVFKQGY